MHRHAEASSSDEYDTGAFTKIQRLHFLAKSQAKDVETTMRLRPGAGT